MLKLEMFARWNLLELPESGMGYQLIDFKNGRYRHTGLAINASYLLLEHDLRKFRSDGFKALSVTETIGLDDPHILVKSQLSPDSELRKFVEARGEGAENSPITLTKRGAGFKRFSAYEDDVRVTPEGSLRPGSYATTQEDAENVDTGSQAVERYALPNPDPAVYVFSIEPLEGTPKQEGIVQPAFGHTGGGVEILFVAGTTPKTVVGMTVIPP